MGIFVDREVISNNADGSSSKTIFPSTVKKIFGAPVEYQKIEAPKPEEKKPIFTPLEQYNKPAPVLQKKPNQINTDRGTVVLNNPKILEAIVYGEATDSPSQMMQIMNIAVNRAVRTGQTLDEVLTADKQFQAYLGDQYNRYIGDQLNDEPSKQKAAIVRNMVKLFMEGSVKNNVGAAEYYVHDDRGNLHYSENYEDVLTKL